MSSIKQASYLTPMEKDAIQSFISLTTTNYSLHEIAILNLTLVITENRPACMLSYSSLTEEEFNQLKQILQTVGLAYYIIDREYCLLAISKEQSRIEQYKPLVSDSSRGHFLGYPTSAVRAYVENEDSTEEYYELRDKMKSTGDLSEKESEYLQFTEYVPEPSKEGIYRAVSTGEKRVIQLSSLGKPVTNCSLLSSVSSV